MTIGSDGTACNDGFGIGEVLVQQPVIDGGAHTLGGQRGAFVEQYAIGSDAGASDQFAGHLDRAFGDALGLAQVIDFLIGFLAALVYPTIGIALNGNAGLACEVSEDERQGAVTKGVSDAGTTQAFDGCLGIGGFTISR